jgi:hypothetical protein
MTAVTITVGTAAATAAEALLRGSLLGATAGGDRSPLAAGVGCDAPANSLGGNARTNLNIRLFDYHTRLDGSSTSTTILGGQHPLAVSLGQPLNRDHTDTSLVVAAITRTEADTPAGAQLHLSLAVGLHAIAGSNGIGPADHFDKGVSLIDVDNAGLDHAESAKEGAQVLLGGSDTTDKQRAAEDFDVTLADGVIPLDELGTGRRKVRVLALGRRRATAATTGWAALAVFTGTPTASTGIARITPPTGGITVVFTIDGAVTAARRGSGATTVPTWGARAAAIASWRAGIITVAVVTILAIKLTPASGSRSLSRHHGETREGSSWVDTTHGVGHVKQLECGRPLVLRDTLGRQELQQLKLLRQSIAIRHSWSAGIRLRHHGGQRVRSGHRVGCVSLTLRLWRHGGVLGQTSQSSIGVSTHCSTSERVRSWWNRGVGR